jgi:hypothetical protein
MKSSTLFLIISLAANAALAIAIARRPPPEPPLPRIDAAAGQLDASAGISRGEPGAGAARGVGGTETKAALPSERSVWSRLYTENLDEFAARLRKAGFPPRWVRMIVIDMAQQSIDAGRARLLGPRDAVPYWKAVSYTVEDPETRAKLAELARAQSRTLRRNFYSAEAIQEEPEVTALARWRFGDLPLERLTQLWRLEGDFDELRQDFFQTLAASQRNELTAADRERLAQLEAEKRRELQRILSPEEFAQYELRSSPTSERLRSQLETFRPTESEYQALFALQRSIDEQFKDRSGNPDAGRDYRAAMDALKPQIEAVLGPDRYADYRQALEGGSNNLNRLMVRLDLPLATVGKVEAIKQDIGQRAEALRADQRLDPVERDARLAALADEAQTKLTTTLQGARGYSAYEQMKGDWIRALRPKPPSR